MAASLRTAAPLHTAWMDGEEEEEEEEDDDDAGTEADSDGFAGSAAESASDAEEMLLGAVLEVTPALEVGLDPRQQRAGSTGLESLRAKSKSSLARRLSKRHITAPGQSLATVAATVPAASLESAEDEAVASMRASSGDLGTLEGFSGDPSADSPRSAPDPGDPRKRPMSWAYPSTSTSRSRDDDAGRGASAKFGSSVIRQTSGKFGIGNLRHPKTSSRERKPSVHQRKVSLTGSYPAPASPSKPHQSPFDPPKRVDQPGAKSSARTSDRRRLQHFSDSATSWLPKNFAPECYGCKTKFWWMAPNWTKHHCRKCGMVFCNACSQFRAVLEPDSAPVRICKSCFQELEAKKGPQNGPAPVNAVTGATRASRKGDPASTASVTASGSASGPAMPGSSASSWMLPGEKLVGHFERIWFENEPQASVVLTTFQLIIFSPESPARAVACIPLMSIERIEILLNDVCEAGILNIYCKNLRFVRLVVLGMVSEQRFSTFHELEHALVRLSFPTATSFKHHEAFACVLKYSIVDPPPRGNDLLSFSGCCLDCHVDDHAELERLVGDNPNWRVSTVNQSFALCASYPRFLAVPTKVSDTELRLVADFRIRRRIPILSWIDPEHHVSICRCSQPKSGPWYRRSIADEKLIREIALTAKSGLVIVDARPPSNASANRIKAGGGFEDIANYNSHTGQSPVSIEFMNLENTKTVRASMNKLKRLVGHRLKQQRKFVLGPHGKFVLADAHMHPGAFELDDEEAVEFEIQWLTKLADSRWMHLLSYILRASCRVVQIVKDERKSVLVHCSDGWDRTAQIVSLAVLCMDGYYRTLRGFVSLVEKDWLSVGHAFRTRYGTGAPPGPNSTREVIEASSSHVAPVFVQFMDCVSQLLHQFPAAFEFSEGLLVTILDRVYSAQFGNFLVNTRKEALDHQLPLTSYCAWDDLLQDPGRFENPAYQADSQTASATLRPAFGTKNLQLWRAYFLRYDQTCRDEGLASMPSEAHEFPAAATLEASDLMAKHKASGTHKTSSPSKRQGSLVELMINTSLDDAQGSLRDARAARSSLSSLISDRKSKNERGPKSFSKSDSNSGDGDKEDSAGGSRGRSEAQVNENENDNSKSVDEKLAQDADDVDVEAEAEGGCDAVGTLKAEPSGAEDSEGSPIIVARAQSDSQLAPLQP